MDYHSKGNRLSQLLFRTREDYFILNMAGGRAEDDTRNLNPLPFGLSKVGMPQKNCQSKRTETAHL